MNLFKKAAIFTDIHFGAKGNSEQHNIDCIDFINWFIVEAKKEGCDTCLFLGDYHNNRNTMNIRTMSYALRGLELLGDNFKTVYFIPGNHDLFYKDKRDVHSVDWARHIPNITIINDWFNEGNVIIAPWMVSEDHKKLKKLKGDYIFGHFELPGYMMNAMVKMPEHGELRAENFSHFGHCFSGHFHKRQTAKNVTYIGNAFPLNYADAWDDERGMMILDWGQPPVFKAWPDAPSYKTLAFSALLEDDISHIVIPKAHLKVALDVNMSFEEATSLKEQLIKDYKLREFSLVNNISTTEEMPEMDISQFESIDTIVSAQLSNITSDTYDTNILLEIYKSL